MGIKGLMPLIQREAPDAVREVDIESYTGRIVAIDASMALYQFLIAIRSAGGDNHASSVLVNSEGEQTSHIQGMFNRTIRLLSAGVKPVYVFDGKPPSMKGGELEKRKAKRDEATERLKAAQEADNVEEVSKQQALLVKVGRKDTEDVKTLLRAMGVPVFEAPCEAEAQCAALCKEGKCHAVGTEDADVLTFGAPVTLRKLTFSGKNKDGKIQEVKYDKVLKGLELTKEQFVDFCILCRCDYTETIRGVGPKTALKLIQTYGTIDKVLAAGAVDLNNVPDTWLPKSQRVPKKSKDLKLKKKFKSGAKKEDADDADDADNADNTNMVDDDDDDDDKPAAAVAKEEDDEGEEAAAEEEEGVVATLEDDPEDEADFVPAFARARELFVNHEVCTGAAAPAFKWTAPDEAALKTFLVEKMSFNEIRVEASVKKLIKAQAATKQSRMDSFFKVIAREVIPSDAKKKRPAPPPAKPKGKKGKK